MTEDDLNDVVGNVSPETGSYVFLKVTDDGCGMSTDVSSRIFEPFYTNKPSGRGLGLAATLGIVKAHGGHLSVKSAPGVGTTMTVLLPPHGDEVTRRDPSDGDSALEIWEQGGTVLVVDDEDTVRGLARGASLTVEGGRSGAARSDHAQDERPRGVEGDPGGVQ